MKSHKKSQGFKPADEMLKQVQHDTHLWLKGVIEGCRHSCHFDEVRGEIFYGLQSLNEK